MNDEAQKITGNHSIKAKNLPYSNGEGMEEPRSPLIMVKYFVEKLVSGCFWLRIFNLVFLREPFVEKKRYTGHVHLNPLSS